MKSHLDPPSLSKAPKGASWDVVAASAKCNCIIKHLFRLKKAKLTWKVK